VKKKKRDSGIDFISEMERDVIIAVSEKKILFGSGGDSIKPEGQEIRAGAGR